MNFCKMYGKFLEHGSRKKKKTNKNKNKNKDKNKNKNNNKKKNNKNKIIRCRKRRQNTKWQLNHIPKFMIAPNKFMARP